MQMSNTDTNIFSEDEVFNYVAGQLSDTQRLDFEKRMATDESLREAVATEQRLRLTLSDFENSESQREIIKRADVNDLLSMLDLEEEIPSPGHSSERGSERGAKSNIFNWYSFAGAAASIAFFAIIFLNSPFFNNSVNQDYTLRSDANDLSNLNFSQLVSEERIAQIWFSESLSNEDKLSLLIEYKLTPVSRASTAWIVASEPPLSDSDLAKLRNVKGFEKVSRISYSD